MSPIPAAARRYFCGARTGVNVLGQATEIADPVISSILSAASHAAADATAADAATATATATATSGARYPAPGKWQTQTANGKWQTSRPAPGTRHLDFAIARGDAPTICSLPPGIDEIAGNRGATRCDSRVTSPTAIAAEKACSLGK